MATWVSFVKVDSWLNVSRKYKRIGQFMKAVKAEAVGTAAWARRVGVPIANLPKGDAGWQVDVEAIPLVRPLRPSGALKS